MAITFAQEKKKQQYLILALILVVLFTLLVVWWGFFKKAETPGREIVLPPAAFFPEIKINWEVLADERLQELQAFEDIAPLEEEVGRKNPFTPY